MIMKRNLPLLFAAAGIVTGFTLIKLNAVHNNDSTELAFLMAGAALCGLAPLAAFMWTMHRKGCLRLSDIICVLFMFVGMVGPSRVNALVPYKFGDIFGLVFWAGFIGLAILMFVRWATERRQNQLVAPSGRSGGY